MIGPRARACPARLGLACVLVAIGTTAAALVTAQTTETPQGRPPAGRVVVDVLGIDSSKGKLLLGLFRSATGFPEHGEKAFQRQAYKARAGALRMVFQNVPPGPFAVTVLHDEDGDFRMDTGLFGIPTEGYGFSRDAHGAFGPPDYAQCVLTLAPNEQKIIRIHLRY